MGMFKVEDVFLVKKGDEGSNLKAFATIKIADCFVVKNLKVIEGAKGLFVSMPQEKFKSKDNDEEIKWTDTAYPVTAEARKEVNDLVLKAYEAKSGQSA